MGKSKTGFFRNNAFLQGLKTHELALLDARSKVIRVKSRQILWNAGDPAESVFWIRTGVVSLYRAGKGDRMTIIDFLTGGDVLAAEPFFLDGLHVVSAQTLVRCELLRIETTALREVAAQNPLFSARFGTVLAKNSRFNAQWRTFLMHRSVKSRVVGALLRLSGKFGTSQGDGVRLELALTHRQIASYIGATREAVSVAILQLKAEDLLHFEGKHAVLHDLKDVQELLSS